MFDEWEFSPSSIPLFEKCLSAVDVNSTNKWKEKFFNKQRKVEDTVAENNTEITIIDHGNVNKIEDKQEISNIVIDDELIEEIETNPIKHLFTFINERRNNSFIDNICERLSETTLDQITEALIRKKDLDSIISKELFYSLFQSFVKHDVTRLCINTLIKANDINSVHYKTLLVILFNSNLPNQILQEFVNGLNAENHTKFINIISDLTFKSDEFLNNIFSIYTSYKGCEKTEAVQRFIFNTINNHANFCVTDRNYGRLLLSFLQEEKTIGTNIPYSDLEKIVEIHGSPFKKPCLSVVRDINELNKTNIS